jgi:hypothetical protein
MSIFGKKSKNLNEKVQPLSLSGGSRSNEELIPMSFNQLTVSAETPARISTLSFLAKFEWEASRDYHVPESVITIG